PRRATGPPPNAAHLEFIRQTRLERMSNRAVPRYANLRDIQAELREVRACMRARHWECLDVSYKATEEIADRIVEMLPRRRGRKPSQI
ncbi:MAG: kinase/pyrophosphorylase, partial [Novipirellula sp. JB048]